MLEPFDLQDIISVKWLPATPRTGRGSAALDEHVHATLKATQGQIDGFFGQLSFKCYLPEIESVGD